MQLILQFLIISLPFVSFPRIGGAIKVSDFAFLLLVIVAGLKGQLRVNLYALLLCLFVVTFSLFGFVRINYFDYVTVLQAWDTGLYSTYVYPYVACVQTLLYILGAIVFAKYAFNPTFGIMKFQLRFFIFWSILSIFLYVLPPSHDFFSSPDVGYGDLRGTFTEKGPMGSYVVFIYTLIMTYAQMPGAVKISRLEMAAFVGICLIDLLLCRSDRGTVVFVVVNVIYLLNKRPGLILKLLPVAAVVLAAVTPLLLPTMTKFQILAHFAGGEGVKTAMGRYAGLILLPVILSSAPYFGVGYGNYIFYRSSAQFGWFLPLLAKDEPGDTFVQMLTETGIVGTLIFTILAVGVPLFRIIRGRHTYLWPFVIGFIADLTTDVPDFYQIWIWLFLVIGAIEFSERQRGMAAAQTGGQKYRRPRLPLPNRKAEAALGVSPTTAA